MRAFIALELPPRLHPALLALQGALAAPLIDARLARAVRWTPVGNIHLTLRFLGETSAETHQALVRGLRAAVATTAPFTLSLRNVGCFPNCRRPAIIWLGMDEAEGAVGAPGAAQLRTLQRASEALAVGAGFAPETHTFAPHLTLGRTARDLSPADSARTGALLVQAAQFPQVRRWVEQVRFDHVTFMQSDLQREGPVYTALDLIALAALT